MPGRKREAREASALWVQGLDKARQRVRDADARMGDACRRVVRRIACRGEGPAQVAAELDYLGADAERQVATILAVAAEAIAAVYEVSEAA